MSQGCDAKAKYDDDSMGITKTYRCVLFAGHSGYHESFDRVAVWGLRDDPARGSIPVPAEAE